MASVRGSQFTHNLEFVVFDLFVTMVTDSSGVVTNTGSVSTAPTDQDGDSLLYGKEIASLAKAGTGLYTLTLSQPWFKLLAFSASVEKSSAVDGDWQIVSQNPRGSTVNAISAKTINLRFQAGGSAVAFDSATARFKLTLKNTNVK